MTTFDDIQDLWNQQDDPKIRQAEAEALIALERKKTRQIKIKHLWTIGILGFSASFFAWYIFRYAGFGYSQFHSGLTLMQFSLLFRMFAEYTSFRYFRRIDIRSDLATYTKNITEFYRFRRKLHYLVTPIMMATYVTGFILSLPTFKQSFSAGFYLYIVLSGFAFFIVFSLLLIKQIRKEWRLLDFLKQIG